MRLARTLIGMVHLPPLPGSPRWDGSMERAITAAVTDATVLIEGGMDALLVENYGDVPVIVAAIRRAVPRVALGVNVLKNDARAALAVACAGGAQFIRVNVHAGAVVADQGIVQSEAYHTLRDRRLLGADVKIFADVQGKHAAPVAAVELEQEARDLVHRGLADALVVSGKATGEATAIGDIKRVRSAVPTVPVLVGSGVTADSVSELLSVAEGVIVGTFVKRDGSVRQPVDSERVRRLVAAARG